MFISRIVLLSLAASGAAGALAYAVMLYQVSGSNAGTQGTSGEPVPDYQVSVTFSASVGSGMPWVFDGPRKAIRLPLAQQARVFFTATNSSAEPVLGSAVFNVVPQSATPYFKKVQCFCDPAIARDPKTRDVREIFASYTFFNLGTEARDRYLAKQRVSHAKQ